MINLYRTYFRTQLAELAQYRANLLLWLISLLIEPIIFLSVWANVAQSQGGSIGGFTASGFAGYYLVMLFVRQSTIGMDPYYFSRLIRSGDMNMMLLRPVHPIHRDFAQTNSDKIASMPFLLLIALGVGLLFGTRINPPLWSALAFVPALLLAVLLRFSMQWAFSLIAFWTDRVDAPWRTYVTLQTFLAGILAPLSLMPPPVMLIASLLPFRWALSFPVELVMGQLSPNQALIGFGAQIIWLMLSIAAIQVVWRAGVRRFGAYGG